MLSQFRFILVDMADGFFLEGLEGVASWSAAMVCQDDHVDVSIRDEAGDEITRVNPFSIIMSRDNFSHEEVVEEMHRDFTREVEKKHGTSVRDFVTVRSDFRNKLLYAEDGGSWLMGETLHELLDETFRTTLRDLIWVLGALICNEPIHPNFGLVTQFVSLYRRVLAESVDPRLGKIPTVASS